MAGKTLGAQVTGGDSTEVAACVCILDNSAPVNTPKHINLVINIIMIMCRF